MPKGRTKHVSYERWTDEPEEAFNAFVQYRDQTAPRSVGKVYGARNMQLLAWCTNFQWRERALEYDRHHDRIRREVTENILKQTTASVAAEHMLLLKDARELVARELSKLVEASRNSTMPGLLKSSDLVRMTDMVVKLDRLIRGETTDNLGATVTEDLDYSKLTLDEIRQLKALRAKAKADTVDSDGATQH